MNKIILYLAGSIFLLGVLLKILFALFFPDRFAEGARDVLFIDERVKAIFRPDEKSPKQLDRNEDNSNS